MVTGAGEFGDCFGPTHIAYTYGCGSHAWATYTAVPVTATGFATTAAGAGAATVGLWWTAIGFFSGRGGAKNATVDLRENDLAPMVDGGALPSPEFGDIPSGAFGGAGDKFPSAPSWANAAGDDAAARTHVVWQPEYVGQIDCSGVKVEAWSGSAKLGIADVKKAASSAKPKPASKTSMVNVVPLFGGVALLGEAGKVTSVSTHRFSAVAVGAGGKGVTVSLRGKAGEAVPLLFASAGGSGGGAYTCALVTAKIDADGTGTATFA